MIELGIDEAGRGPVIGPMVVAAVAINERAAKRLRAAGVDDSKAFGAGKGAREKRQALAREVRAVATYVGVRTIGVSTVDARVSDGELNHLEREQASSLIEDARLDCPIVADGKLVFGPLAERFPNLRAENKAEANFVSVAAASIIAKTHRDELYAVIAARYAGDYGEVRGGGYTNAATSDFLRRYTERRGCLPPEARHSWPHNYLPAEIRRVMRTRWKPAQLGLPL